MKIHFFAEKEEHVMQFEKQVTLKNGRVCTLRSGRREDAQIVLDQARVPR